MQEDVKKLVTSTKFELIIFILQFQLSSYAISM